MTLNDRAPAHQASCQLELVLGRGCAGCGQAWPIVSALALARALVTARDSWATQAARPKWMVGAPGWRGAMVWGTGMGISVDGGLFS